MATNVEEDCKKDTEETNLRPIKLNKTTNITKIKGWRNKTFNLEIGDRTDVDSGSISKISVLNRNVRADSELDNNVTTNISLTEIGKLGKHRNSELLDCLVKKIGDPNDNPFGNAYISSKSDNLKYVHKEIMKDSACFNCSPSSSVSEEKEKLDTVSSDLPEATKSVAFLKSAFISESLDNFLSGVMNLSNIHEDKSSVNVKNLLPAKTEVVKPDESDPKSFASVKVVDEYGKKPRTLAEKRRILERVGYPHKILKIDDKVFDRDSSDKHFSSHLNEDDNFKRKDDDDFSKRVLRSSITNNSDVSSINIKLVRRSDGSLESVPTHNSQSKKQLKGTLSIRNLFKLRREVRMENRRMNKKIKKKFRKKLSKTSKMNKALSENVYIKPLKKRIFIDFMPLLKEHEIVTQDDREFTESVRMIMFLGVGRCLYEEQAENLDLLRNNSCIINENFAHFATSTVLDRKHPKKIARILIPVVSTKLLTFMKRYNLIKERYNEFLVNKFKIDVSVSTHQLAHSQTQVSAQNLNDFQNEESKLYNSIIKSSNSVDSTSQSKCDKQTNPSALVESKCFVTKKVIADHIKQTETTCSQEPEASCNSGSNNSSPSCKVKFKKRIIKNGRIFHEDKRIKKLNYELRRLNHAFVEIEGESDANILNSSNEKDMTKFLLPDDIIPNKLAKVESEFHQTIMKSKEDFVFVSSFGERARRNRKLPKKLEDTIMSSESDDITSKLKDSVLSRAKEPVKVVRNLRSNVVQLESSEQSSYSEPDKLKPLEKNFKACKALETKCDEVIEKELCPNNASSCQIPLEQNFEACKPGKTKCDEVVEKDICPSFKTSKLLFKFKDSVLSRAKEPVRVVKNLTSNIVQLESSEQSSCSESDDLKPLEENIEASKSGETKCIEVIEKELCPNNASTCQTPLERNFEVCKTGEKRRNEVLGKELVIVQTAQSILKKNVLIDGANDISKCNNNSLSTFEENKAENNINKLESVDSGLNPVNNSLSKFEENKAENNINKLQSVDSGLNPVNNSLSTFEENKAENNINKLESVDSGLNPVVLLKRIMCRDPMRIWCLDHSKYDCSCLSDKASPRVRNVAVKRTNPNYSYKLDFMSSYKAFIKQGYSNNAGKIEFGSKNNKEVDAVPTIEGNIDVIPRIENIMSLKPEDFFKDDCSNISGTEDSAAILSTSCVSQNEEKVVQLVPRIQLSESLQNSKAILNENVVRCFEQNNFRFFCVCLNYPFSYIKFWIGSEWKSHFKERLLVDSIKKNSNLFILIPFNFICNMINEAIEKRHCVFQSLMKSGYNPSNFNNLPFGVYAASTNMVLFGPYAESEAHRLQAYKFYDEHLEEDQLESSQAKQIPFVNPEYKKEFEEIDYTYGFWWNVVDNKVTSNKAMYDAITTKRISRPVMNASIVVPVMVPLKKDDKGLKDLNKQLIRDASDSDKQNSNFENVEDILQSSESEKDKSASKNNTDDITKIYPLNFDSQVEETGITTSKTINEDCLNKEGPSSCNSQNILNDDNLRNRLGTLVNSDLPVKCKKSPVLILKNSQITVVYPQEKNGDNNIILSHSNVQQLIQELGRSMSNKNLKMSVQPNALRNPVPLCKIKQIGNTTYYCLKNNRKHIFKIKNVDTKIADKNILLCTKIGEQNFASSINTDSTTYSIPNIMNGDSNHCMNIEYNNLSDLNLSRQLQKTVETETYVDYISEENVLDKRDTLDKEEVSATDVEHNSASILPKMQITGQERKNSPPNGLVFPFCNKTSDSTCIPTKSNELQTKKMSSTTGITKFNLEKYRREMKNSHGFIPITSDLLRNNVSGLSKCNVNVIEKTDDKIVKSKQKISSLLKVTPSKTPNKYVHTCSQVKLCDAGFDYIHSANQILQPDLSASTNFTKDQFPEVASNNEDILLGFTKSIESIKRMKSSGSNSAKGVLLKVKFKDDPQLFKLNVEKCSDTTEIAPLPKENKNPVERCNPRFEQSSSSVSSNINDSSFDFSISKNVTGIQRKRVVNQYDSPHCSDEILLINDQQGNSSTSNCSDFINIDDSVKINTVIDKNKTGLRIVNDENNPLAYLTSTCDYTSSQLSLSINKIPIDGTVTPFSPEEKSAAIESVYEPKNTPSSPPLLKRMMMKLVKEAKSVSEQTTNTSQDTAVCEELKLVSNLDSLPNFLESYGIHFTDDDI